MSTRGEIEKELRTNKEDVRYSERRVGWVGLFVVLLVAFLLSTGPLSVRSSFVMLIAIGFLAIQIWTIVLGRQRIKALSSELEQLDVAQTAAPLKAMPKESLPSGGLGEFRWDSEAEAWVAEYVDGDRHVRAVVDGDDDEPNPVALRRAKDVFSRWGEYKGHITAALAAEADSYRRHGLYDEVMSLHVAEVEFSVKKDMGDRYLVVYFEGVTRLRLWRMELDDSKLLHLGFDRQ